MMTSFFTPGSAMLEWSARQLAINCTFTHYQLAEQCIDFLVKFPVTQSVFVYLIV